MMTMPETTANADCPRGWNHVDTAPEMTHPRGWEYADTTTDAHIALATAVLKLGAIWTAPFGAFSRDKVVR